MTHALFRHVSQFAVSCPVRYESLRDKSRGALRASRSRRLASEAPPSASARHGGGHRRTRVPRVAPGPAHASTAAATAPEDADVKSGM